MSNREITAQDITPGTRVADGSLVKRVVLRPSTRTVMITWSSGWTAAYGTGHTFQLPRRKGTKMITLAEYREMINKLANEGVGFAREVARDVVAAEHGFDAAEDLDRRFYRRYVLPLD